MQKGPLRLDSGGIEDMFFDVHMRVLNAAGLTCTALAQGRLGNGLGPQDFEEPHEKFWAR